MITLPMDDPLTEIGSLFNPDDLPHLDPTTKEDPTLDATARETRLRARLEHVEASFRQYVLAMDLSTSLIHLHGKTSYTRKPEVILAEADKFIDRMFPDITVRGFFTVREDVGDFPLTFTNATERQEVLETLRERLIDEGEFAWAINHNRFVLCRTRGARDEQVLMHVLATKSRVRGMFIGLIPKDKSQELANSFLNLLSLIVGNTSYALESAELYRMLDDLNQNLDQRNLLLRQALEENLQAHAELEESEQRFRQMVEQAVDPVLLHDLEGRLHMVNQAACDSLGYNAQQLTELLLSDIDISITPEKMEKLRATWSALPQGEPLTFFGTHKRRDSTTFPVEMRVGVLEKKEGKRVLSLVRDITERRQTEQKLHEAREIAEEANREKSEFLANMSHEIRSPMNAIMGMTDLVLNTPLEQEQRQYLEIVRQSSDALLFLLNSILDFSRIEAGRMRLESTSFNLRNVVEDACRTLAISANQKGLQLLTHVRHDLPRELIGDPHRLRQVVINLVNNAIKFTQYGEIIVQVAPESTFGNVSEMDDPLEEETFKIHFTVSDTGIGIPPEIQEKIFAQFTQADGSIARRFGGTGLGLTICREIVSLMGGRIWVESDAGQGSHFHFVIPLPADSESTTERDENNRYNLNDLRIVIVDPHPPTRQILREILSTHGAEVILSDNGTRALKALDENRHSDSPCNMVLFDCRLPDFSGFDFAEALTAPPRPTNIKSIAMLPPNHRQNDTEQFHKRGVFSTILKPVKAQDLLETILIGLGRKVENKRQQHSLSRSSDREPTSPNKQGLKVLLAEDNPDSKILAERILERNGHTMTWAENGAQVLEYLKKEQFDVILMDINMPIMDGITATRLIRHGSVPKSDPKIPIIAITADAMHKEKVRCLDAGMDLFISKPYRPAQLQSSLESLQRQIRDASMKQSRKIRKKILTDTPVLEHATDDDPDLAVARGGFPRLATPILNELLNAHRNHNAMVVTNSAEHLRDLAMQIQAPRLKRHALRMAMAGRNGDKGLKKADPEPLRLAFNEVLEELKR
ncbi:MAG: response regulator [Magnetococcales bacterium]|nr:response regulator [Magnetococcales bacterium]